MNQGHFANAEPAVIDWNLCVKLANNKREVAQEILLFVIQQLPVDLETIQEAYENADYTEMLRCVHKLHGALCYSGMPRLKNTVAELEGVLKQARLEQSKLRSLYRQLEVEAAKVLTCPLPC